MKEIEVKAKITNREDLISKLAALGCHLSEPVQQKDRIFVPEGQTIPTPPGVNVLRLRQQDSGYIVTLKQAISNQLDCVEREMKIDDPGAALDIFRLLGFYEVAQVNKQRQKGNYQGLEICLDAVEGLGDYIEVEKLSEDANGESVQKELFEFLKTLGIRDEDRAYEGYDVIIARLNNNI